MAEKQNKKTSRSLLLLKILFNFFFTILRRGEKNPQLLTNSWLNSYRQYSLWLNPRTFHHKDFHPVIILILIVLKTQDKDPWNLCVIPCLSSGFGFLERKKKKIHTAYVWLCGNQTCSTIVAELCLQTIGGDKQRSAWIIIGGGYLCSWWPTGSNGVLQQPQPIFANFPKCGSNERGLSYLDFIRAFINSCCYTHTLFIFFYLLKVVILPI